MDANDNKTTFKTSFKGFDKKDVVEYIRLLSAKYDEQIKEKTTENEICSAKLVKAEKEISAIESQLTETSAENVRLKNELDVIKSKLQQLEDENSAFKHQLEELGDNPVTYNEKLLLESEVARLTGELAAASAESEKSKLEIADIVIKAEQISKKLRDEAVANANYEKEAIERQIVSKKSELMGINGEIERMKSVFADLYKKYVKE